MLARAGDRCKADPLAGTSGWYGSSPPTRKPTPSPRSELPFGVTFSGWTAMSSPRSRHNILGGRITIARSANRFHAGAKVLRFAVRTLFSRIVPAAPSRHSKRGDRTAPVFRGGSAGSSGEIDRAKVIGFGGCAVVTSVHASPGNVLSSDSLQDAKAARQIFQKLPSCAILRHSSVTPLARLVRDLVSHQGSRTRYSATPRTAVFEPGPLARMVAVASANRQVTTMCERAGNRSRTDGSNKAA